MSVIYVTGIGIFGIVFQVNAYFHLEFYVFLSFNVQTTKIPKYSIRFCHDMVCYCIIVMVSNVKYCTVQLGSVAVDSTQTRKGREVG